MSAVFLDLQQRRPKTGRAAGRATFRPLFLLSLLFVVVHTVFAEKLQLAISFMNKSPHQSFKKLKILSRPRPPFCPRKPNLWTIAIQVKRVAKREKAGDLEVVFIFEACNFFRNQIELF